MQTADSIAPVHGAATSVCLKEIMIGCNNSEHQKVKQKDEKHDSALLDVVFWLEENAFTERSVLFSTDRL